MSLLTPNTSSSWKCMTCGALFSSGVICTRCFTHKAPDRAPYPQIFQGLRFHFNGIIQKSLLHQSFNKEWRMAVAHGAECTTEFDIRTSKSITHLIYRKGYERSDKVRSAVMNPNVYVVPIEWMLDCMMSKKRLPEVEVRLRSIPVRALPLDATASVLEHQRHPYYVANQDKFPEPSAAEVEQAKQAARVLEQQNPQPTSRGLGVAMKVPPPPPEIVVQPLDVWPTNPRTTVPMFAGLKFAFSETVSEEAKKCAAMYGAAIAATVEPTATHFIYSPEDRKSPSLSQVVLSSSAGIRVCPLLWLQDCIQAREVFPNAGPYLIPQKVINSIKKKATSE